MVVFKVQGSGNDPYEVSMSRDGDTFFAFCTCRAGSFGQLCKHVLGILDGSDKAVVENEDRLGEVPDLIRGTEAEAMLADFRDAEAELAAAKKNATSTKKKLAKALRG